TAAAARPLRIRAKATSPSTTLPPICRSCASSVLKQDANSIVCGVCGLVLAQTTATELSWQEMVDLVRRRNKPFSYKRINHFNEGIMHLQAKGRMKVDPTVLTAVRSELEKDRITNIDLITAQLVRDYLHKLEYANYYDVIPYIIKEITGDSPTQIAPRVEDQLRAMFLQIQDPYKKHMPGDRSSFLNYNYVTHKLVELLNLTELKPMFKLLKSQEKLRMHDDIWEKICGELGWQFIRTV
ncbi:hypothetical protein HDU93_004977, partial [Gonapodya sp. JEL0774]